MHEIEDDQQPKPKKVVGSRSFRFKQNSFLNAEGVGTGGSYEINGGITITENNQQMQELNISAEGLTLASQKGDVQFGVTVKLYVNFKLVSTKNLSISPSNNASFHTANSINIGSAAFQIPRTGNIQISISGGYIFSSTDGTYNAAPTSSLERNITIRR
jgi:hypothetical protein